MFTTRAALWAAAYVVWAATSPAAYICEMCESHSINNLAVSGLQASGRLGRAGKGLSAPRHPLGAEVGALESPGHMPGLIC